MAKFNDNKHHVSNLFEVGTERLKLIGDNAKLLMQGYLAGGIDPSTVSERTLRRLISARVLYQPDDSQALKLRHPVTQLVAALVTDESRRAIHADIADKLMSIHSFVEGLREAQRTGDSLRVDSQMLRIDEAVYDLTSQFEEAIFSLWHRLNSNFGFVNNLSDKIRENNRAQQQINRLIDGLSLIDFDELIELAANNPALRKILVTRLQQQMSAHQGSLLEVQKRLVELMTRFREQQERSLLVLNMVGFLREHPSFMVGDYSYRSQVPTLVNYAAPIVPAAAVALDKPEQQPELVNLVHTLYRELAIKAKTEVVSVTAAAVNISAQQQVVEARQQQLKEDAMRYFIHVCEAIQPPSALVFLVEQQLQWSPEVWLFQVLAEYNTLPRHEQQLFSLTRAERQESRFNHLQIIEDIEVRYQAA
ncbi:hypothetical protein [Oceanisphaera sp. IT1-181]|uniref:hypothetical protein n=1 Tax=Oceanisphaera sp. IT1-181 TaxID=3081199 RepID=UPI0029CA385B|nr:hypothetical protein [Oceanisphaera sp. IT1-181]